MLAAEKAPDGSLDGSIAGNATATDRVISPMIWDRFPIVPEVRVYS